MNKKFIFLSFLFGMTLHAIPFYELNGADEYLDDFKAEDGYQISFARAKLLHDYLLKDMRFKGHYAAKKKGNIEAHPKLIQDVHGELDNYPQDHISSLIQHFFPSANRRELTYNQDVKNAFGALTANPDKGRLIIASMIKIILEKQSLPLENIKDQFNAEDREKYKAFLKDPAKIEPVIKLVNQALAEKNNIIYAPNPKQIVCDVLLAFALCFTNKHEELKDFYPLFKKNNELKFPEQHKIFSIEDYNGKLEQFRLNLADSKETLENIMLFYEAYNHWSDRVPTPWIQKLKVSYENNGQNGTYADCGETMMLNFIRTLFKDPNNSTIDLEKIKLLAPNSLVSNFFEGGENRKYISFGEHQEDHNAWSQIISNLNAQNQAGKGKIFYLKNLPNENEHTFEMNAGMFNFIMALGYLLDDKELAAPWKINNEEIKKQEDFDKHNDVLLKEAKERLERWCHKIEKTLKINLAFEFKGGKYNAMDIEFNLEDHEKNGDFLLHFEPQHFEFKKIEREKNESWIKVIEAQENLPEVIQKNPVLNTLFISQDKIQQPYQLWFEKDSYYYLRYLFNNNLETNLQHETKDYVAMNLPHYIHHLPFNISREEIERFRFLSNYAPEIEQALLKKVKDHINQAHHNNLNNLQEAPQSIEIFLQDKNTREEANSALLEKIKEILKNYGDISLIEKVLDLKNNKYFEKQKDRIKDIILESLNHIKLPSFTELNRLKTILTAEFSDNSIQGVLREKAKALIKSINSLSDLSSNLNSIRNILENEADFLISERCKDILFFMTFEDSTSNAKNLMIFINPNTPLNSIVQEHFPETLSAFLANKNFLAAENIFMGLGPRTHFQILKIIFKAKPKNLSKEHKEKIVKDLEIFAQEREKKNSDKDIGEDMKKFIEEEIYTKE